MVQSLGFRLPGQKLLPAYSPANVTRAIQSVEITAPMVPEGAERFCNRRDVAAEAALIALP